MIGKYIRSLIDKGYTQVELAKMFDVSQAHISRYLSDINNPTVETLVKIADIFNVTTDHILGRDK
jgi:transcriptional regulator with XRE-family HTH domain